MAEYLAPGVYVEEVSYRSKSIEGVGTSVAAVVGPTRFGPLRGVPEVVTSYGEFARIYGDLQNLEFDPLDGDKKLSILNHTAIAAKAFFDGGGKQLYVSRIGKFDSDSDFGTKADSNTNVTFKSRFPGEMGNLTLEFEWRDSENLLRIEPIDAPTEDEIVYMEATGLSTDVRAAGTDVEDNAPDERFPINIRALVRRDGDNYIIVDNRCIIETADDEILEGTDLRPDGATEGAEGILVSAGLVNKVRYTRVSAKAPATGALSTGDHLVVTMVGTDPDLETFSGHNWSNTAIYGTLDINNDAFVVAAQPVNPAINASFSIPLAVFAAVKNIRALMVQRNFDISVRAGGTNGQVIYTYTNITSAPEAANSLAAKLAASPEKRHEQLASPVSCELKKDIDGDEVMSSLWEMFENSALHPSSLSFDNPRYLIELQGGSDGKMPSAIEYAGISDELDGSSGFAALEDVEDISIVIAPAASAADKDNHQQIVAEMQKHCRKMRYRVGIVDSQENMSLSEVRDFRSNFDDSRLALYYPWVVIADPRGISSTITVPPAGFIAGVYANTDVQRGVHKAPANEPVYGALRFAQQINPFQQELLNPNSINCLRSFPGRGHRVWGGRTLSSDPEWKYVNVRRYFLYLERSIEKSTQWVVFEPNGEALWDNVRATVESFLYNEWRNGRLLGSEKTAYFVRCDRSTMTQNDIDNGRLVCEIGVAALKPAEFVVFRIGQKTADA